MPGTSAYERCIDEQYSETLERVRERGYRPAGN